MGAVSSPTRVKSATMFLGGVYCISYKHTHLPKGHRLLPPVSQQNSGPWNLQEEIIPARKQKPPAMVFSYVGTYWRAMVLLCSCLEVLLSHSFTHSLIHAEALMAKLRAWNTLGKPSTSKLRPQTSFYCLFWPRISPSCSGCPWTQADFDFIILLPQPSDYLGLQDFNTRPGFKFHFPHSDFPFLSYWDEWAGLK